MTSLERNETFKSDKGTPHFRMDKSQDKFPEIIPSSKDVFRGHVLVDRLLVYYSKFEGSRHRAVRYAQKLLDMGHIESLTHSRTFEDSVHVYRWTDVAQVLNKTKIKANEAGQQASPKTPQLKPRKSPVRNDDTKQALFKISIETDNCEGAEIQARIRARPRISVDSSPKPKALQSETVTTFTEDSFFGGNITRALSYVTEPSTDNLDRGSLTTPIITELSPRPAKQALNGAHEVKGQDETSNHSTDVSKPEQTYQQASVRRTQKNAPQQKNGVADKEISDVPINHSKTTSGPESRARKTLSKFLDEKEPREKGSETKKLISSKSTSRVLCCKSATEPAMSTAKSPGTGVAKDKESADNSSGSRKALAVDAQRETKLIEHRTAADNTQASATRPAKGASKAKEEHAEHSSTSNHVASTQTSEKSILHASGVYNGASHTKNDKKDAKSPTLVASTQTSEKSILRSTKLFNSASSETQANQRVETPAPRRLRDPDRNQQLADSDFKATAKAHELQRSNENQKKARFFDQNSTLSESATCNGVQRNESTLTQESTGISLHSSGFVDKIMTNGIENFADKEEDMTICLPPPSPAITIPASPPVSPTSRNYQHTDETNFPPMKSLFWNKLVYRSRTKEKGEKIFWDEPINEVSFDQMEFEKLFQKPAPPPESPHAMNKSPRKSESGRILKVLSMERSRQVSIRAGSVRLPVEEIHDAITGMDDDKLDADGLQALFDLRPTAEELDAIADILKAHPKGILDKPEQFLMMMAMIPTLDERLECWIFAKKFPEKMVELQEQLNAINEVCQEIVNSCKLERVLKTILVLGNHMNQGTQRGDADGYHLDILPKIKDVKSHNGELSLLHYTVKIVREQLKLEGKLENEVLCSPRRDETCGLPDQELLSRAISTSLPDLGDELEATAVELEECRQQRLPAILRGSYIASEAEAAQEKLEEFLTQATAKMRDMAQLYQDTLTIADEFQNYFVPSTSSEPQGTLTSMLTSLSMFCDEFRSHWAEEMKQDAKEQFYKMERGKRQRQNAIRIQTTPSALKERFMANRKRERKILTKERDSSDQGGMNDVRSRRVVSVILPKENSTNERNGFDSPTKKTATKVKRNYKFESDSTRDFIAPANGYENSLKSSDRGRQSRGSSYAEQASKNAGKIESRMQELQRGKHNGIANGVATPFNNNLALQNEHMLKSKTC